MMKENFQDNLKENLNSGIRESFDGHDTWLVILIASILVIGFLIGFYFFCKKHKVLKN